MKNHRHPFRPSPGAPVLLSPTRPKGRMTALLALALYCATNAHAQTWVWTGNSNGNWNDNARWNQPPIEDPPLPDFPNGVGHVADFTQVDVTANRTITLPAAGVTVGTLVSGDTAPSNHAYIFSNHGTLTLDVITGNTKIERLTGGQLTFQGPIVLNDTLEIKTGQTASAFGSINFNGQISGAGGVILSGDQAGAGRRIVFGSSDNSYDGNTVINEGGNLRTGAAEVIPHGSGKGNVTINDGGRIELRTAGTETINGLNGIAGSLITHGSDAGQTVTLVVGGNDANGTFLGNLIMDSGHAAPIFNVEKIGAGTQVFGGNANVHTGTTTVSGGTLLFNGTHTGGGGYTVAAGATLGGSGSIDAWVDLAGTISPGGSVTDGVFADSVDTLTVSGDITFHGGSTCHWEIADWTGEPGTGWDFIDAGELIIAGWVGNEITIAVSGWPENFAEEDKSFTFALSDPAPVAGFSEDIFEIDASGFVGNGTWAIVKDGNSLVLEYTAGVITPYTNWAIAKGLSGPKAAPGEDADGDGVDNLTEFALDGDPLSGANDGKVVGKVAEVGGQSVLTLTLPVRTGATFSGATRKESDPIHGAVYRIEASENLVDWDIVEVSPVTGEDAEDIQDALPALTSGDWEYRTFRVQGTVAGSPKRFIRAVVESDG